MQQWQHWITLGNQAFSLHQQQLAQQYYQQALADVWPVWLIARRQLLAKVRSSVTCLATASNVSASLAVMPGWGWLTIFNLITGNALAFLPGRLLNNRQVAVGQAS